MAIGVYFNFQNATLEQYDQIIEKMQRSFEATAK